MVTIRYQLVKNEKEMLILNIQFLLNLLDSGEIDRDTLLFNLDTQEWQKVSEVRELAGYFVKASENESSEKDGIQENNYSVNNNQFQNNNSQLNNNSDFYSTISNGEQNNSYIVKKKKLNKLVIILPLVFGVLILSSIGFGVKYIYDLGVKQKQFEKATINKMSSLKLDYTNYRNIKKEQYSEDEYGVYAPLLTDLNDYYVKMKEEDKIYLDFMENSKISELLSLSTITNAQKILKARSTIQELTEENSKYSDKYHQIIDEFINEISKLDLSDEFKSLYVSGVRKSVTEEDKKVSEIFNIEGDCYKKADNVLSFMQNQAGKYVTQYGKIYFNTQSQVNQYNSLITEVNSKASELRQWLLNNQVKSNMDDLGNINQ